ncbi:MAG: patatin-like phospholipase family protein [Gammaproteobacteria bacterium]|nr:patatin-like phospholipase family protein [Gammaproteobacteria bacterium]
MAGGGARAAYQVGVLKAIAEMLPEGCPNPFPVLCGTSAGAINATALAIYARRFHTGVRRLNYVWRNFEVHRVYRSDAFGILKTGAHWLAAMVLGGLGKRNPTALLDRAPLRALLEQVMPCDEIQKSIDAGELQALSITCSGYGSGQSVTFYQGVDSLAPWKRARRVGAAARITLDHLMASSAIPFVFGAVPINREYFGDGSMRQEAPVSPALHLGADRVLVIGVRHNAPAPERTEAEYPSLAQVAGHVLNSIFIDALEVDLERMQRINKTISFIPESQRKESGVLLRHVDVLVVSPSEDPERIAARFAKFLPRPVRFLFRGLGAYNRGGSNLISYLLFEKPYCQALIGLGYADAMVRRKEILEFLGVEAQ